MEIEPINKKMIGEIKLNYYIRVRTSNNVTPANIKLKLSKLLKGIDYDYSIYSLNSDKQDGKYLYNLLVKTNEPYLTDNLYRNISGKGEIELVNNKILIKIEKPGTKKGKKNPEFVEEFRIVEGENFNGKKMDIRIVPILDKDTSIYYVSKYATDNTTSHTGFITPLIFG